ncbi:TMEM175 family protein [Thermogemmatispora aurantia]|uniref:TMEM175 family protein n=1 Tax=Thermogemmatispora aurantia TaxID=2045279 RepID=UPI001D155730|nr:TMEM175 family protein [Thermogemmatispora aurantia]
MALPASVPRFFIHIMIFFLCSSYWYAQHRLMDRMSVVDGGFSALCLLFLFLVTLLPVSMNVFGCYPTISPAIALYTLNLAGCGLALVLLTWYAVFHRQLLERTIGHQRWEHALYYGLPLSVLLLSSLLLLLFTSATLLVIGCWMLIPAMVSLARLIGRRRQALVGHGEKPAP